MWSVIAMVFTGVEDRPAQKVFIMKACLEEVDGQRRKANGLRIAGRKAKQGQGT